MIIIGIVGLPAGGKSTVAAQLAGFGATWINADKIAHEVLQSIEIATLVSDHFGAEVQDSEGKIDRRKLGKLVFGDDDSSRQGLIYLESLIHPKVKQLIALHLAVAEQSNAVAVVLDIPLLFETGWADQCDEIWFIDTLESIQFAEAERRGWTTDNLTLRQSRQLSSDEKRRRSTHILRNHNTLKDLQIQVEQRWHDCLQATSPTTNS